jgi:bifunctional DNase/RNase
MSDGGPDAAGLNRVSVSEVRTAVPTTAGVEAGMVTLREDQAPFRAVPIVIGQPEARAIQSAWSGIVPPRPSTWDLFVSTIGLLDGRIDRAVITAVEEGRHFFATIELERGEERRVLSARPSDAVALALRSFGAEIYVAEQVMVDLGLGEPAVDN